jgi:hypothetical protein
MLQFVWLPAIIVASGMLLKANAAPSASPQPSPAAAAPSHAPAAPANHAAISDLAPADEYFGKMRLSVVRMHHEVFALKDDLHHRRQRISAIAHEADDISDACYEWARRFPKDRWVPRTAWELATLYEELPGADARDHAITLLDFLRDHYGDSSFGAASVKELARGVGVRPWPHWASVPSSRSPHRVAEAPASAPPPKVPARPTDAPTLLSSINALESDLKSKRQSGEPAFREATNLEEQFRRLSRQGTVSDYDAAAWELGTVYQLLPGEEARTRAIRMLALVLDRYSNSKFAAWSLRDLERGVGVRR